MKTNRAIAMAVGMAATLVLSACDELKPIGARGSRSASTGDKVKVEMYVMSKCGFGVQALQGISPTLAELGDRVDLKLDYIVTEDSGAFKSLKGEPEVKGNIQQLCAIKFYPETSKYMAFIDCQNQSWQTIPDNWEQCADRAGMDKGRLRSCIEGNQGKELLRESMKRSQVRNAQGSPTIFIADEAYHGGRAKNDFLRAICAKIGERKPEACTKIPEDIEVLATVLTDKRCKACETEGLEKNLRMRFFPKLKVKKLDYADEEGKKLFQELKLTRLPVMLFESSVEKAERYATIARWMEPRGSYKQLRVPAQFDPTAEICDNKIDDTGNGLIDCDDPTCKESLVCRKEMPRKLDVFVMSQCPYGVQALDAMKEVLDNFKGKMSFDVHYIADKTETGFNALHGQPEVSENIRQLCAKKHYPRNYKYMDYIWCRNKNYRSDDWKPCATGGINPAVIEKCSEGDEGKQLLEENIKLAKSLDISGSPTWLANNRHKFNGVAPEQIKNAYCEQNKGLAGCEKKLTERAGAPSGSCGQ